MPALGQKLGYLYGKAETKTSKYADRYASQTFPHLGNQKTKGDEQKDILNNIQNLYKVANKREVTKIQDEFYKVYVTDDMMQLQHFASQLDIISEGYQTQSLT